jgi:hypothetical protein
MKGIHALSVFLVLVFIAVLLAVLGVLAIDWSKIPIIGRLFG